MSALLLATMLLGAAVAPGDSAVAPPGVLDVRFADTLVGGRVSVGTTLLAVRLAPWPATPCDPVPARARVAVTVTESAGGRWFGRGGRLGLRADSLEQAPGRWVPITGVLDSLEWTPKEQIRAGVVEGGRHGWLGRAKVTAAAAVVEAPLAPVAGFELVRRGGAPIILGGEVVRFQLLTPVPAVPAVSCSGTQPPAVALPPVPPLPAVTAHGAQAGDPVNLVLLGDERAVTAAFATAGWTLAGQHSSAQVLGEVGAAIVGARRADAPVSAQELYGRVEDLAFERMGHSVRQRHHVRLWQAAPGVWIAAGTEDIGLAVNLLRGRLTHRVDPAADHERDAVVRELVAGCAESLGLMPTGQGGAGGFTSFAGVRFRTDGRAAVVRVSGCAH